MSHPTIAILLATYNGERFLRVQIDSILHQTYQQWRLYIHDDGSRDGTKAIIEEYATKYPEKITLLSYPSKGGSCLNFMSMLEQVEAKYYMFTDQDDVWHADKIEKTFDVMARAEKEHADRPIVVHTDLNVVDESLRQIHPSFWQYSAIFPEAVKTVKDCVVCVATGCTMLFNAKARQAAIQRSYRHATMHDAWVTVCCYAVGGAVLSYPHATIDYRQHGSNTLGAQDINRLTIAYRISHLIAMQRVNWGIYRMLNSVAPLSLFTFYYKKMQYKKFVRHASKQS